MTDPHAVITRLAGDFAAISGQLARVSRDLTELDRILGARPVPTPSVPPAHAAMPGPVPPPYWPHHPPAVAAHPPPGPRPASPPPPVPTPAVPPPAREARPRPERSDGWIGKALAVAGVAVTLIGVVLLLVLAAQAGILRPEVRVGAGALLAGALVAAGHRLNARAGGRVGAIALAATGVAAAYLDVIAVTTIYHWFPPPVGLVLAAAIGGGGLLLARRWDSQHLGLLVLVPLIVLAPVLTDGVTVLLIGFMLALGAASLPVQLGKDWLWMQAARTAAVTLPLLAAVSSASFAGGRDVALTAACGAAAVLALGAALLLLPSTENRAALALLTGAGVLPVLCLSLTEDRLVAALMAGALAAALLAIVLSSDRLPGVDGPVRRIWSVLAAIAALIAVTVAFDGPVAGPMLLAMALVIAVAGRTDSTARWVGLGFAGIGGLYYLGSAPPSAVLRATVITTPTAVSILIASVLLVGCAAAIAWSWPGRGEWWTAAAAVLLYALTTFTVTAGVLVGGPGAGFFAGHMAATICWIALAAALLWYAARRPRDQRSVLLGGGLALVAAAVAKLFLFDLGTLDGIFRVVVFIVVGLVLLGMGGGYARFLAHQDHKPV